MHVSLIFLVALPFLGSLLAALRISAIGRPADVAAFAPLATGVSWAGVPAAPLFPDESAVLLPGGFEEEPCSTGACVQAETAAAKTSTTIAVSRISRSPVGRSASRLLHCRGSTTTTYKDEA